MYPRNIDYSIFIAIRMFYGVEMESLKYIRILWNKHRNHYYINNISY